MNTIRVDFEDLGVEVKIYPATSENGLYANLLDELTRPHQLAMSLDRLSDKVAMQLLAEAYSRTVVAEYDALDEEGWMQWFLSHPVEFHQVIFVAEHPDLWVEWSHGSQ